MRWPRSSEVSLIWVVGDTPPGAYTSVKGAATRAQPELIVWLVWLVPWVRLGRGRVLIGEKKIGEGEYSISGTCNGKVTRGKGVKAI